MVSAGGEGTAVGRPRDASIDDAVLDATLHRLARDGFAGLSLASVAAEAGTSRPAIYRRWPDKESLVVDAIARLAQVDPVGHGRSLCVGQRRPPLDELIGDLDLPHPTTMSSHSS